MSNKMFDPNEPIKYGMQFNPLTDKVIAFDKDGFPIIFTDGKITGDMTPTKNIISGGDLKSVTINGSMINSPGMRHKKCIVLTVRKTFMKGHPRAGIATGFPEKIKNMINSPGFESNDHPFLDLKLHTIRAGQYWKKVVEKVNAGTHYLSVRTWDGRPYVEKGQTEVATFEKLGWQEFVFKYSSGQGCVTPFIDGRIVDPDNLIDLANNDGLDKSDFLSWFNYPKNFDGGIIHFTDLLYFKNPAYFIEH